MSKYRLDRAGKLYIKEFTEKFPKFPRMYISGEKAGTPIFKMKTWKESGKSLLSRGITQVAGKQIEKGLKYTLNQETDIILNNPLDYVMSRVLERGIDELSTITEEHYKEFDLFLKWNADNPGVLVIKTPLDNNAEK